MAAIAIGDCTVSNWDVSGVKFVKIVTAATAAHADTIDISTLFNNGAFALVSNASDTVALSAVTYGDKSITLPGSADNEARTILCIGE